MPRPAGVWGFVTSDSDHESFVYWGGVMTDTQQILEFLNSIATKKEDRLDSSMETGTFVWGFKIQALDQLGLLLSQLKLRAKFVPSNSIAKQAEAISKKLTYLAEGFKLLEHDIGQQTLFLRSSATQQRNDRAYYFEIVLKGGSELVLDHYEFDRASGQRRSSPANLSRDTFERLVQDLQTTFVQ